MKGGATGGGYSQIAPMEDINLHFTGDLHAITIANNLLSAMIDNHIYFGNSLDIQEVTWKRCMDINDRQLRKIETGLSGENKIVTREDGFDITAASEIMAILCLAENLEDLKKRLGNIIIGYNFDKKPIYARDLKAEGAMTVILKDAIKPNLVQTLEHTPAIVHGGPFANIAHGCNSVVATKTALKLADFVVTEAGFGADLGAEKFLDIKCRNSEIKPDAVVIVATIRALKYYGGAENQISKNQDRIIQNKNISKSENQNENQSTNQIKSQNINQNESQLSKSVDDIQFLQNGMKNLFHHIENIKKFGLNVIVALNKFSTDTEEELEFVIKSLQEKNIESSVVEGWEKGGAGAIDIAKKLTSIVEKKEDFKYIYNLEDSIKNKIEKIAKEIYGASGVEYSDEASKEIARIENLGYKNLPICIAKTQYSFSDDPQNLECNEPFSIKIREVNLKAGAGFVVAIAGKIMTMPGLPKVPVAENIDIDENGNIVGMY